MQDLNKFVAISEEFANNAVGKIKSGGLLFDRKVTRVITPGTLIDEKFMDPYENNFLLAIQTNYEQPAIPEVEKSVAPMELNRQALFVSRSVGLAWLDLSTGDFFTQVIDIKTLPSALTRIGAREVVLNDDKEQPIDQNIKSILNEERHLITYHAADANSFAIAQWAPMLETAVPAHEKSLFTNEEIAAGCLLLSYVKEKLQGLGLKLQPPVRRHDNESLIIDKSSLRGLEVLETSKDGLGGGKGSLLHSVRRTITKSGTRLLRHWIGAFGISPRKNSRSSIARK